MTQTIVVKLTKAGTIVGPFDICDQAGNIIAENVTRASLVIGVAYSVADTVTDLTLKSTGTCTNEISNALEDVTRYEYDNVDIDEASTACLWEHLTDQTIYNSYYGKIAPFIVEYPFAYQQNDEILQNVESYNKVFKYYQTYLNSSDRNNKVQVDDAWFNKSIIYNGQQSSGILELNAHPENNMQEYLTYPKFNAESKSILWSREDNMYQYNTFWSLVKDKTQPLFLTSCESLSIDKVLNQTNMDYSIRAYRKDTIRAKDLKVRHILDDKSDIKIVTQFIVTPSQISYN